jgi:hypothetical protein
MANRAVMSRLTGPSEINKIALHTEKTPTVSFEESPTRKDMATDLMLK